MDMSNKELGCEECILCITEKKHKMSVCSIPEIGVDRLCVGFELVAELKKRFGVGFALKLGEFWELKVGLTVIDTGGDHRHNLTITKLSQREVKMISLVNYEDSLIVW